MMKVLSFLLVGLSGFVERAGSKHAFSSSKTPKRVYRADATVEQAKGRRKY